MKNRFIYKLLAALLLSIPVHSAAVLGQAPWSGPLMQRGIAAVTCGAPAEDNTGAPLPPAAVFTFGLMDLRTPAAADYAGCGAGAPLWNPPMYHDPSWNAENLGNVFGITLDAEGNIYLAAHGLYGTYRPLHHRYGNLGGGATDLSAAGTVYRIDAITGAASVFAVIPGQQTMTINSFFSSGPGLGNLAYDAKNDQFFVSSLEDGKIYRLDASGAILNDFDPLTPDNGAAGLPPRDERVWAVEVSNDAVFYSIWNDGDPSAPGVIRSVAMTGSGDFNPGSDAAVLTVPPQPFVYGGGTPVSDIAFSLDGQRMIIGMRTMYTDSTAYNHVSKTHMAELVAGVWTVVGTQATGCHSGQGESYGGVALGEEAGVQEAIVWSSSADMAVNYGPHGLFGVRIGDFPVSGQASNSFKVPYDPSFVNNTLDDRKGSGGDIEIIREGECAKIRAADVACPEEPGEPFELVLDIQNSSPSTVHYAWLTPCPTSSLPAGSVTAQPEPSGIISLPSPLDQNESASLTFSLPGNLGGQTVCFRVTLLDAEGKECCTEKICVDVPACDCAEVLGSKVDCELQADGTIKYTITLTVKNLTHLSSNPYPMTYVSLLPPTGFSPSYAIPSPNPIPPGGVGTVELCYFGFPGTLCFNIGLHDETLELCCSPEPICLDLPDCPPGGSEPDACAIDEKVVCSPETGLATVNYTICNNSSVARTYSWFASGTAAPGCAQTLTAAGFSPSNGTVGPIAPGDCATVTVTIDCAGFEPGDCAGYQICARYNDESEPICCRGVVHRPDGAEPFILHEGPDGGLVEISPSRTVPFRFRIVNPTEESMTAQIGIRDSAGALAFSSAEARPAALTPLFESLVELAAFEERRLTVEILRWDDGDSGIDFTGLEIGAQSVGRLGFAEPDLIVPIRLTNRRTGERLAIEGARVELNGKSNLALTIPTQRNHRYRVEQSTDANGGWSKADCATQDASIDQEGFLVGTGSKVTAYVECDSAASTMFFRIMEFQ